ncbi:MAG: hemerythrin domain-containing protein [Desulfobacteraceae bacterium]|nr:hemerythrin domain-containing protein [Desulfobacteraceae bacterium]
MLSKISSRRDLLKTAGAVATGIILSAVPGVSFAVKEKAETIPAEILMRDHGVLHRLILVFEECLRRIEAGKELPNGTLGNSAEIVRRFVEGYHNKFEEEELFPRFESAGKLGDLVKMLFVQHQAGRRLTIAILDNANGASDERKQRLIRNMREFVRMYQPHMAREETVIFPSLRMFVSQRELEDLQKRFDASEQEFLARQGYAKLVDQVAKIEKQLSILELSQFTPPV